MCRPHENEVKMRDRMKLFQLFEDNHHITTLKSLKGYNSLSCLPVMNTSIDLSFNESFIESIENTLLILPPSSRSSIDPSSYLKLVNCPYPITATEQCMFFLNSLKTSVEVRYRRDTDAIQTHMLLTTCCTT